MKRNEKNLEGRENKPWEGGGVEIVHFRPGRAPRESSIS